MSHTDPQPLHASQLWLSADVAKLKFDASWRSTTAAPAQPADLRKMKTRVFERTAQGAKAFLAWGESLLAPDQQLCIVMEATAHYSLELVAWLLSISPNLRIAVIRGKLIKDYASGVGLRSKTDKIDACAIACYGAERRPPSSARQSGLFLSLRALTRLRQSLKEQLTENENRMESLSGEQHSPALRKLLVKSQNSVIKALNKEVDVIESELEKLIDSDPELTRQVQRITSIPGVGWATAVAVLGEMGDLRLYDSSRQLTSFAGLNPKLRESGKKVCKARISKQGSSRVRRALFMSNLACTRHNERLRNRRDHLVEQGKTKMVAAVANMRTLLTIMRAVVVNDVDYDENHLETCGKAGEKPVEKLAA